MTNIETLKKNIAKIERQWKTDIKKEHGGGLDSGTNMKLIKLKIALRLLEKSKKRKNKPQSKR